MFLGVHAYAVVVIAIIDPMNAATILRVDVISGVLTVAANAWVCSKNGAKHIIHIANNISMQSL